MNSERQMRDRNSPVRRALRYVERILPFEGTIGRACEAARLRKAYLAGFKAGRSVSSLEQRSDK